MILKEIIFKIVYTKSNVENDNRYQRIYYKTYLKILQTFYIKNKFKQYGEYSYYGKFIKEMV